MQKNLFESESFKPPEGTKHCLRCHKLCRVAAEKNPKANLFVKGTKKTGRYCTECLIVDFFQNCAIGPASAMGAEFFNHALPQPSWRKDCGDEDRRFDPESLRQPEIQGMMTKIIIAAQGQYAAELTPEEIDWLEVISNWNLPFPEKKPKQRKLKQ